MRSIITGCEAERGWVGGGGGALGLSLQIARWVSGWVGRWEGELTGLSYSQTPDSDVAYTKNPILK
jgi:hypothetical protein